MTFLDHLNSSKFDFTENWSGDKIIKYQQSQALTSHFESFWSIVHNYVDFKYEANYQDWTKRSWKYIFQTEN